MTPSVNTFSTKLEASSSSETSNYSDDERSHSCGRCYQKFKVDKEKRFTLSDWRLWACAISFCCPIVTIGAPFAGCVYCMDKNFDHLENTCDIGEEFCDAAGGCCEVVGTCCEVAGSCCEVAGPIIFLPCAIFAND